MRTRLVRSGTRARGIALGLLALAPIAAGCDGGKPKPGASSAASSAAAPPSGSAVVPASLTSSTPAASATAVPSAPVGNGVEAFDPVDAKACKVVSNDVGTYLKRGEIDIAGRDGAVAAVWLIQLPNRPDSQVAFAGYDAEGHSVARGRGIGNSHDQRPSLFASAGAWSAAWLDGGALAHLHPSWDEAAAPTIEHLPTIGPDSIEDSAIAAAPNGALVAVAPFGAERAQLSLFLFAPTQEGAPPVQAVGVTHHAHKPKRPAVTADEGGYFVAWQEEGGKVLASRFDPTGKETEPSVIAEGKGALRDRLLMTRTAGGAVVVWLDGTTIHARGIDASAKPVTPPYVVGTGKWPALESLGEGAVVAWVGRGKADEQLLVARLDKQGAPAAKGLVAADVVVKDPPSIAVAGARLAFAWTEVMSTTVSTKRAMLRLLDASCLP